MIILNEGLNMSWKDAILEVIRQRNGREITLQEIYKEVMTLPIVTEFHKEPWKPEKQPKYECWIRSSLSDLVKDGSITRSRKAVYKSN
jgi:hypothetical protein